MASIIEKLQKLIAHERSCRDIGSQAEAEAFAVRIQTLLTEHKLTMTEVEFEAQDKEDPIGHEQVVGGGRSGKWQAYIAVAVARNLFCKSLYVGGQDRIVFLGRDSDRRASVEMYGYLVGIAKGLVVPATDEYLSTLNVYKYADRMSLRFGPDESRTWLSRQKRTFKNSFLQGFALAIYKRLSDENKNLTAAASGSATSLMLRDAAAIEKYQTDVYGKVQKSRAAVVGSNSAGFASGKQAGSAVSLKARTALTAGA